MRTSALTSALTLALGLCFASASGAQPAPDKAAAKAPVAPLKPVVPAAKTAVTWYGHAAFKIETPSGKTMLVDPWLQNPTNPTGKDDVKSIKADLILVTHGHFDHVGDATEIAKRTKAKLVATFDLGNALVAAGYPKDQFGFDTGGNFGGSVTVLDGEVTITFVPAVHSSNVGDGAAVKPGGNPGGFLIQIKNGPSIYHTGDTDVFGDMAMLGKFAKVDLMLACIGDHFTMGPDRAAEAVKLVKAMSVAPMHFGTFPVLTGTTADFAKALKKAGATAKLVEFKVGTAVTL
jgi:L-ascorbate metabolism protein UlaG (beta-lactamase superfamily)